MSENLKIEVNLSIDRSGGDDGLPKVIDAVEKALKAEYTDAEIAVRKGFFQTIDGIWASDSGIENDIRFILDEVRKRVLSE
ncbi:MAG: hypothetical protein K2N67_00230 [Mucispirillum sp.]|nr:hypothetical protein [Mucispirillum sp.]